MFSIHRRFHLMGGRLNKFILKHNNNFFCLLPMMAFFLLLFFLIPTFFEPTDNTSASDTYVIGFAVLISDQDGHNSQDLADVTITTVYSGGANPLGKSENEYLPYYYSTFDSFAIQTSGYLFYIININLKDGYYAELNKDFSNIPPGIDDPGYSITGMLPLNEEFWSNSTMFIFNYKAYKNYKIEYNLNAPDKTASYGTYHPTSAGYEDNIQISNPTRTDGYHFTGWTINNALEAAQVGIQSGWSYEWYNYSGGLTTHTYFRRLQQDGATVKFTANWKINTYKVRFNANGGSGPTMSDQTFTYGTSQKLTKNTFTRAGHTFAGWNTEKNGTGISYSDSESVKNLTTTNGDTVTLYAQWDKNQLIANLDYKYGGQTGKISTEYNSNGTKLSLPSPERTGYTFKGWNTASDGSGWKYTSDTDFNDDDYDDGDPPQVASNHCVATPNAGVIEFNLYAIWEANEYTVRFDSAYSNQIRYIRDRLNGGSSANTSNHWLEIGAYDSDGINYALKSQGATSLNSSGAPTQDYLLDGSINLDQWQQSGMSLSGNGYQLIDLGQPRNIEYIVVWHYYGDTRAYKDNTLEVSSDGKTWRTIFSTADTGTYTETKNGNKVYVNAYRSKTVTYNTVYGKLPSISKTGYTFNGWFLNSNKIETNTIMTTANDHLLKSSWTVHEYNIAFDSNRGSGEMASKNNVKYDSNVTLPENAFKRAGYVFTGWNTKSDGKGTPYSDKATVNNLTSVDGETVTLYAQWEDTWANHASSSLETTEINGVTYNVIASAEDLAYLSKQSISSTLVGKYIQTADIDLSEYTWLPIGSENAFCGEYLGQGHKITGLKTSDAVDAEDVYLQTYGGLFGKLGKNDTTGASANIVGVYITGCQVYGEYSGAIAGLSDVDSINIEACILENIEIEGNTTASFVGLSNAGHIKDCLLISSNISTTDTTTHGFYTGAMTIKSCYFVENNSAIKFTGASSDYSNWIEDVFMYPLPSIIVWYPNN